VGKWSTKDLDKIRSMELELNKVIRMDAVTILLLASLLLFGGVASATWFIGVFTLIYTAYIFFNI